MEIIERNNCYEIKNLSWNDAYRIQISLKKISELIGSAKYDGEFHRQEALTMKSRIDEMIDSFIKSIPSGIADGIEDDILKFI